MYRTVTERDPDAAVIVPPAPRRCRATRLRPILHSATAIFSVLTKKAGSVGRRSSGYNKRSRIETAIGRYKQVIGDGLRFRKDERRTTEVAVAVHGPEPHAGAGTPDLRPHRMKSEREGAAVIPSLMRTTSAA